MKIKAHHVKMARAAWRLYVNRWPWVGHSPDILRWHRAAKGKHQ